MKRILEQIIDRNTEGNYLLSSSDKAQMISEILDLFVCSTWCVTNQLRWKQKEVNMIDGTAMNISELQQMWQSDKGEQKWEAVPFVE